jgi:predicted ATPase/class 3 adenylate cyclase
MNIVVWLRSLGLEEYEATFRENEIDETILPNLTAEDLKDLGIGIVGHRRKILNALAGLRVDESAKASSGTVVPKTGTIEDRAERRQVTVMFSDLVGSAALSLRMDPEDLREVISAYHTCVEEIVSRFGGFVAQYMGDGVLVCFGYPQAHEHDAERAVQAGLELVAAVSNLKTRAALLSRVGIATGLVVVGDLMGSGEARERAIIGETPNLAARLQGIAEPNMVVIAEGTRKLLGNLFDLKNLGAKDLKGIAGPVHAWATLRLSSAEGRFEALHASGLTDLIGRAEELELLLRRWSKALTGEGQVVLLSGEAGIGKSRLTAALLERLATEPHTRLRYFCSPQHTDSSFYPIIGQMERAAGLTRDDAPQRKLDKLDAMLAQSSTSAQDAALLVEMLSLPNDGRYPALDLSPQQRRQRTLDALVLQVMSLSRQNPVLMILEDAHWSDPTSVELFGRFVDRIRTLRALLIVTFRPEFEPPWIGQPHTTALTIRRLTRRDIDAIIDRVDGNKHLSPNIRQDIIERTDGIPLFVEEMTKAVLEAEREDAPQRTAWAVPSAALTVPASLHAPLMARLDRLGPAREVAQIGAAIGREFSHALLDAVVRKPEAELQSALDRLITSGLLFRQGVPPHANYLFKHALVQDAAYNTLLREPRCALHVRIVETLESQFPEIVEGQPELLAHHCTNARLMEKAASLWDKAGHRSLDRSALVEAAGQFNRALNQIAALPLTPALRHAQIKLQVALINPLVHVKGYAAPETKAAAERARLLIEQAEALGEAPEDPLLLFSVLYAFWGTNTITFNGDLCRDLASRFLALAEKQGTMAPQLIGHRLLAHSLVLTGNFVEGRAHYNQALALYDPVKHRPLATQFGQDPIMSILSHRSWALWFLGCPESALADVEQALTRARDVGNAATSMYALFFTSFTHCFCGNYATGSALIDELAFLATKKEALPWKALGKALQGSIFALTGRASDGAQLINSEIAGLRQMGATLYLPFFLSNLARAFSDLGQFDDSWRCAGDAITMIETSGERWYQAEAHRIAGEIALTSADPDAAKAEVYIERALAIARAQQAKSWELRAAMSMARLQREQGKPHEARDLLAAVYGCFTEGFDTLDLKEAEALLYTLASCGGGLRSK